MAFALNSSGFEFSKAKSGLFFTESNFLISKFEAMATIDKNIKEYRNKLGLTQGDLVRKSGVKHTTLTKIEGDFVQKPSVQVIAKIAEALGVSIEELIK